MKLWFKAFRKRLKKNRPDFRKKRSFEEFNRYCGYREELSQICKSLGLEYRSTKQEMNYIIEQYFRGNRIEKSSREVNRRQIKVIAFNTLLLACGFSFHQKYRNCYSTITGVSLFGFNADMATACER